MIGKWHDPQFRANHAKIWGDNLKKRWKDHTYRKKQLNNIRAAYMSKLDKLSEYARKEYDAARADGFGHSDALDIARDAETMKGLDEGD